MKDERTQGMALVLSGGGARGAYQAGAIKALVKILHKKGIKYPFPIVSGASAGAINAAFMAAWADDLLDAAPRLAEFWTSIHSEQVFRTDLTSLGRIGMRWVRGLMFSGIKRQRSLYSLLDTKPLRHLLDNEIPFWRISDNIKEGFIDAVEITATDYGTSECISFIQTNDPKLNWVRARRRSVATRLGLEHVMASTAIPIFFPPLQIGRRPYGDGCLRNTAPLSAALQLGATKLLIVGVRMVQSAEAELPDTTIVKPTIARVLSVLLNAIFMDALEFDLERTKRINATLDYIPKKAYKEIDLRKIEMLILQPTEDLGLIAGRMFDALPSSIKYLFRGLGSSSEASELVSYLLFEPSYCGYLVELGYNDTLARKDEVLEFFKL